MDLARSTDAYLRRIASEVVGESPSDDRPTVTAIQCDRFPAIRIAHAANSLPGMQFGLVIYQTIGLHDAAALVWDDISHLAMGDPLVEFVLCWIDYDGDGRTKFLLRTPALGGVGFSSGNDATSQAWRFINELATACPPPQAQLPGW